MKVVIVGGVAAGASCAARLRRLDENAEIIMIERSGYVSYANCGLPYYIGGTIQDKKALTLQTPQSFSARFNVDARVKQEVTKIDKANKNVTIKNLESGDIYSESYDKLVLCPGAKPIFPDINGSEDSRIFTVRTVEDALTVHDFIEKSKPQTALIVGGGYIGLEMAENLTDKGVKVTLVEKAPQVISPLDEDMAQLAHSKLREKGIDLLLNTSLEGFEPKEKNLVATLDNNNSIYCDMAILAIGVTPDTKLAKEAGLSLGVRNTIEVNEFMQTSDENIYAAGDAVQIKNSVTNQLVQIPLAGPANRQGRLIADAISGIQTPYNGAQGSSILKLFDYTIAATGLNERAAKQVGIEYEAVVLPAAASHATYYPGAENMVIKVLFAPDSGKLLGAQIVGQSGVDKRIDVLACALYAGLTSKDLAQIDLCYAPPFSSAKDPVNVAGNVMENIRKGLVRQWHSLEEPKKDPKAVLLDVRSPEEYKQGAFEGSINIPVDDLRKNLSKLDKQKHYYVNCASALRSYLACRTLSQNGFECYNFSGGYRYYSITHPNEKQTDKNTVMACGVSTGCTKTISTKENVTVSDEDIKKVKALGFLHCKGTDNFNGRIITRNGKLTNEEMAVVTEAAKKYGNGEIAMTTRLTLEVQEIPFENIKPFRELLQTAGLITGGTGSKVRPVVSCKGTTCQYGLIDTFALSQTIHDRFFMGYNSISLPHKFKIAVGGCPNNCVKPDLNDLGIIGQHVPVLNDKCISCKACSVEKFCPVKACNKTDKKLTFGEDCNNCGRCVAKCPFGAVETEKRGYKIYIGGRWGKKIACGRPINKVFTDENEVLDVVEKAILLFREQGISGERFSDTVKRIGFEEVEKQLLNNDLLERKSQILGLDVKGGATC